MPALLNNYTDLQMTVFLTLLVVAAARAAYQAGFSDEIRCCGCESRVSSRFSANDTLHNAAG